MLQRKAISISRVIHRRARKFGLTEDLQFFLVPLLVLCCVRMRLFGAICRITNIIKRNEQHVAEADIARMIELRCQNIFRLSMRIPGCRMTCLMQALTLQLLLRRHGIAAEIKLGIDPSADNRVVHAWVESAWITNSEDLSKYIQFDSHPFM